MCLKPFPTGPALGHGHVSRRHLSCSMPPPGATLYTPELHTHYSFRSTSCFWRDNLQQLIFVKEPIYVQKEVADQQQKKRAAPQPQILLDPGGRAQLVQRGLSKG